jgi:hypothetical protein
MDRETGEEFDGTLAKGRRPRDRSLSSLWQWRARPLTQTAIRATRAPAIVGATPSLRPLQLVGRDRPSGAAAVAEPVEDH